MAALGTLLAGFAALAGFAGQPLTVLAAFVLAGAVLAAALALIVSVSGTTIAVPVTCRARALREKSWRAAFQRQRDPDAPGRARPRAPSAAQAAAVPA